MEEHQQQSYRCEDGQVVELHESEVTVTVRAEAGKGRPKKGKGEAEPDHAGEA